ncbi:prostatic spermine-binding protein [Sarcophilus harrisii]|uniref:prostatic spermine-binding protein n=1 Tax=Sarcophilus harrisii TaxID=9305 RepID=UPI00062BE4C1|nr:prostatic spermine-binding protein [Sarcophilus harrisii]
MQFFLALVALGGIACSFHGVHSYESHNFGPGHFSIFKSPEERIEGLQFFFGPIVGLLKGVKLRISNQWTKTYGHANGKLDEFVLRKNENIKKITTFSKLCIRGIEIETDAGRTFKAGNPNGQRSTIFPPEKGMVFNGITGYFDLICIKRMIFHWTHILQTIPTPEVTTEEKGPENTSTARAKTTQAEPAKTTPVAPANTTPAATAKTTPAASDENTPTATAENTPASPTGNLLAAPCSNGNKNSPKF